MAGKKNAAAAEQNLNILNQHRNAKKEVKIWKLQLHDKTSYVMNKALILAANLTFEKCSK